MLPKYKNSNIKKTLILDIDETMIHCLDDRDPEDEVPDIIVKIPMGDDESYDEDFADAGINIRPHLYECLKLANQHF